MNQPHTLEVTLTGGATYDQVTALPADVRRIEVKSKAGASDLKIRYNTTDDPWPVEKDVVDDTGWLPDVFREAKLYVNGTGVACVRYWT